MYLSTPTGLIAGPFDVISIVKDVTTGRYHVYVLYESPLPGLAAANPDELMVIRLKSKMHHTTGAGTYEEALEQLAEIRKKIQISDENVWSKPEQVVEADFSYGFVGVFFTRPWRGRPEMPKLTMLQASVTMD